jgi:hypothetical protein
MHQTISPSVLALAHTNQEMAVMSHHNMTHGYLLRRWQMEQVGNLISSV